jgi:cytochrome c5
VVSRVSGYESRKAVNQALFIRFGVCLIVYPVLHRNGWQGTINHFFAGGFTVMGGEDSGLGGNRLGGMIVVFLTTVTITVMTVVLLAQFFSSGILAEKNGHGTSDEDVAKRLKPVGEFVVGESLQVEAAATGADTNAVPAAAAVPADPAAVYTASCAACHATGAAGAPKLGDKAAWVPRIKAGNSALYDSALKGKNAMPPKGGNASLSDSDVKAVVDYMISQSK